MKSQKVLDKIKHSIDCGQTTPLGTKPNDECYTSQQDILNEMGYWAELNKFRNKRVICPVTGILWKVKIFIQLLSHMKIILK